MLLTAVGLCCCSEQSARHGLVLHGIKTAINPQPPREQCVYNRVFRPIESTQQHNSELEGNQTIRVRGPLLGVTFLTFKSSPSLDRHHPDSFANSRLPRFDLSTLIVFPALPRVLSLSMCPLHVIVVQSDR